MNVKSMHGTEIDEILIKYRKLKDLLAENSMFSFEDSVKSMNI